MRLARESIHLPKLAMFVTVWLTLTAIATLFDYGIAQGIVSLDSGRRTFLRDLLNLLQFLGKPHIHILVAVILLALPNAKRLLIGYAAAAVAPGVVVTALKISIGRARPKLNIGPYKFHFLEYLNGTQSPKLNHGFLSHESMWHSFPSGEGTGAFALATVLGLYFPRMRYAFWVLASWTALARVCVRMHFLSDTVFGAGLGILCVLGVAHWLGKDYFTIGTNPNRIAPDSRTDVS